MSRKLAYLSDGFTPAGPKRIRCNHCHTSISSNAYVRASHRRTCPVYRGGRLEYPNPTVQHHDINSAYPHPQRKRP